MLCLKDIIVLIIDTLYENTLDKDKRNKYEEVTKDIINKNIKDK